MSTHVRSSMNFASVVPLVKIVSPFTCQIVKRDWSRGNHDSLSPAGKI